MYWHSASTPSRSVRAWGWSDISQAEAIERAEARLERILSALRNRTELERYSYCSDNVILEPVIREVPLTGDGRCVISRNAYGALVLNSSNVLFIDVDVEISTRRKASGFFAALFGKKGTPTDPFETQFEVIRGWQTANPTTALGCYRTFAGFRLVVLNRVFAAASTEANAMLDVLCNDPLYRILCRKQQCFRARLTPKPWRIGLQGMPGRHPHQTAEDKQALEIWEHSYLANSAKFSVCQDRVTLGHAALHPDVAAILEIHDKACCRGGLPLA
jgi:hypothetical protein